MKALCNILMLLFVTTAAIGQQINPVPDYIFRNQMSVGRNAPTDTAAYLSVGPRFGAVKGFQPPMVVDTNAVTGVKRNGLLIFSVQLNNFAYWDSTTSRFRKITAEAVVDSLLYATRAWRQKGIDSVNANVALKVNISDTSTMLGAYLRKGDTSAMLNPYLRKGDTSAMLSPYYRSAQATAALALKVNVSDTSSMLSPYLRKVDTTAMLSPYVRIAGVGLSKATQTLNVDTVTMATRVRVQKAIDSIASISSAGTVTSVGSGFGTNFSTITTTGSVVVDSVIIASRARVQKAVDSLGSVKQNTLTNPVTGTGTTNYVPKFTGTSAIGNSQIFDNGTSVGIGNTSPAHKLHVNGSIKIADYIYGSANTLLMGQDGTGGLNMYFGDVSNNITGSRAFLYAKDYFAFLNNGVESVRINSAGNMGIGTSSPTDKLDVYGNIRVQDNATIQDTLKVGLVPTINSNSVARGMVQVASNGFSALNFSAYDNDASNTGYFSFVKARGTASSPSVVQSGDLLGVLLFEGFHNPGNSFPARASSRIAGVAEETFSSTASGGSLRFSTVATGSTSMTERMRIFSNGRVGINTTTDAGYQFDIAGNLRTTTGANFATSSGNVGIGTTSPSEALHVVGRGRFTTIDSSASPINMLWADVNGVIRKTAPALGTVTSVGAGFGMSFNTISATGNVAVDSSVMATRARVQKGIDSVASLTGGNIYSTNGTLTGNRTITKGGYNLTLKGDVGELQVENAAGTNRVSVTNDGVIATGTSLTLFAPSAQPLILSSGNGEAGRFSAEKEFLIGTSTDVGDFKLQVNGNGYVSGRMTIASVDSFATAQNMLFVDNDGRVKKAAVPGGGGGTVTSVGAGFGMSFNTISTTGNVAVDSVVMATRARVQKGIDSVAALARVTGSGTTNYVPLWTGSTALGNSSIYEASSEVLIGTTSDAGDYKLQVNGNAFATRNYIKTTSGTILISNTSPSGTTGGNLFINSFDGEPSLTGTSGGQSGTNVGLYGLRSLTTGRSNVAIGHALNDLTTGSYNVAIGYAAGDLLASGTQTYDSSIFIGAGSRASADNVNNEIVIGATTGKGSKTVTIGRATVGTKLYFNGSITTEAPAGGTEKPWKLGEVSNTSPTSPNRTIRVEIDGTVYYLHAKTTND